MGGRARKRQVLDLLRGPDFSETCAALAEMPAKEVINGLFPALCRLETEVRWRAVTCMGQAVARLAEEEMEEARTVMRRFLWSLNDESGGIGWGAPEAMAETMCRHPGLAGEYVHMLLSYMREDGEELYQDGNFIEHPLLQRGLLWGVARMAECRPDLLVQRGAGDDIRACLHSTDGEVRGLAALAVGRMRLDAAAELAGLIDDPAPLTVYADGLIRRTTVGAVARESLQGIRS